MEVFSILLFGLAIFYLVTNWIARLKWMHSYPLAHIEVLKREIETLKQQSDYFKDEIRRSNVAKMYIRAGSSIFAKTFVDRAGNVLVTDNLFCRMLSDGLLKKPTSMQFLPDSLRGLLVMKFGSDVVATHSSPSSSFTVDRVRSALVSQPSRFTTFDNPQDVQTYLLRITGSSITFDMMIRTGAPNDFV